MPYRPFSIQGATDGPGTLAAGDDQKYLKYDHATGKFVMATGGGGVTDHGALTGLADDDHAQYHNDARGDARYSLLAHTHAYQPLDADLTAIAGLVSAADKVPYFTGAGSAALADSTAFGRARWNDADAAALRTAAGLGTIATQPETDYFLLAGRAGGTIARGGNAANDDLTLEGTSHATKTTSYVLLQPSGGNVGIATSAPAALLQIQSPDAAMSGVSLQVGNTGNVELITNAVDRDFSGAGNWTGTNWAVSAGVLQHTAGSTADAVLTSANMTAGSIISGRTYYVTYTVAGRTAGTITAVLGTVVYTAAAANGTFIASFVAGANDANLIFRPTSTFDGSIDNISIKRFQNDFIIRNDGVIGIGTTAPARSMQLDVYNNFFRINQLSSGNSGLELALLGTSKSFWGMAAQTNTFVTGSAAGDTVFRAQTQNFLFTTDGGSTIVMALTSGNLVGIGVVASPTALLDIAASTTARASLRVRAGVAPTSPNEGDLWYDGTNLKFRDSTTTRTITWT